MAFSGKRVGFIGSGVMAEAMIKGLIDRDLLEPEQVIAADPREDRGRELVSRYGLRFTTDNAETAAGSDVLVISTKPQVVGQVFESLNGAGSKPTLVLSILAGVRVKTLTNGLGNPNVVRAMPNTPAQIGEGITVWTATKFVSESGREQARALLGALGDELYMDDEKYLDMTTALSGTGPAYVFLFMEALIDAGVHLGFSRRDAERLVLKTVRGSVDYAMQSGNHQAVLRNQVTSPGGTSAEAIYQMEKGGLRTVISKAVYAAYQRSVALGKEQEKKDEDQ
ncbi:MAG: pyrroline-5-carboxylate reductase [Anaerolineae bacterium]|nr:pyrroline-5-carboxylate reductase [Anaerolineae bacterium]